MSSTRLKLTVGYAVSLAVVMAAFSVALYFSVYASTSSTLEATEGLTTKQERSILNAQLGRATVILVAVNVLGWVLAAGASYVIAGWTLGPLEAGMERQQIFTAHASHELRTPLTVILGELDVTLLRERSAGEYTETLLRVRGQIEQLDSIATSLLSLARLDRAVDLQRAPGNLAEACDLSLADFRSHALARRIDLISTVPRGLTAYLDWSRIRQLLHNLISNAIRHADDGGVVRVSASCSRSHLDVEIFNSGPPIPSQDLPKLFLPFYRGARSKDGSDGTGLGLALCDWIVRAHGGSITAANQSGGVRFSIHLPLG